MSKSRLTTACLINHHNYGAFIVDAVRSALDQSIPIDEIVVVDDGSSSEHLDCARKACAGNSRVRLIEKSNGGQLSCFNVGFQQSSADVVLFLDADDFWDPGYVAAVLDLYVRRPDASCVVAARRLRFSDGSVRIAGDKDRDLGYSVVRCHRYPHWLGAPTSCLSARRSVLSRFLPFDAEVAWRTCADECLVYGTSLAGARKYQLGSVHVNYRVHGSNRWYGRRSDASELLLRRVEALRLVEKLRRRLSIPTEMAALAPLEYRTIQAPTWRDFRQYSEVILNSSLGIGSRLRTLTSLSLTHCFGRKREQHG